MTIKDFYTFGSKLSASTFQAHAEELENSKVESGLFDHHKLIMGYYEEISFPVVFKQYRGNKLKDVLDTGWAALYLISDKLLDVLKANNFTGWQTFPVKILDKKDNEIAGYHGLSVTGRCGPINYKQCEIEKKRLVPEGPLIKFYKGLYVGLDKWDGSDFFLPEAYYKTIVTSKVAEILKENKLTNVVLQNLADFEIPEFALKK